MKNEKRDFDKEASEWDEIPGHVKLASDIAAAMSRHVPLSTTMDVLDFGCGTGLLTLPWARQVRSITGVDSSQGMLDVFAAKAAKQGFANIKTLHLDLDKDETLTGKYDLIVSSMTLHHIRNIKSLLHQFHGVLVPSGLLCLADLDLEDGQFHRDNSGVFHFGFERGVLRRAFVDAGFDDVLDTTAVEETRPISDGEMRRFTVFLMMGLKRERA
ncbi:MAG: class I SAM-dependent methyltransferase [Candidatus Eisenbacteria bacterium]|nr:class I SAM-dependent methyltransferase [Candidatus Eisenbacteria bacterium]